MVSHTLIFEGRGGDLLSRWEAYRLDHIMLEELGRYLKDCPGFSRYNELHREKWTRSCEASYCRGGRLVQEGEKLLQSDDVTQEDFLDICEGTEEFRMLWKQIDSGLSAEWRRFFILYDMVMSDAGDFEAMYAAYLGVKDAGPSPEFLTLTQKIMWPVEQVDCGCFPAD